jgi:hypothetical protein
MNLIGQTKFRKMNPKPGYTAPYLILPWGYHEDLIGRAVDIYECEEGFLLKVEGNEFKHAAPEDITSRLSKLEVELTDLKNLVKRENSPEQIRTAVAGSRVPHD